MNVLKMTSQNDLNPYNLNKGHSNKNDGHSSCSEPSCMNTYQRSHSTASISIITNVCNVDDAFCLQNEGDKKNSVNYSIKVGKNESMTNHKVNNASSDQLNKLFRRANLDMSQYCSAQNASKTIKQQHNLKLLQVNIRSINAGLDKLNDLLALTKLSPDIILVSEAKLKTSENLNNFLKGYKFMHKGTCTNWGGVGVFAKENISIKVCHEFDLNIPDCEDIWVQIELEHGKKCVIGVIYHPKQNLNRFHLSFEKVLELLSCKNVTYYIGGDFNINLLQN